MKTELIRPLLIAALALLLPSAPAFANRAETMLVPQRIVLENGDRYATMIVKNSGDATGNYTIEPIDMNMQEDGAIIPQPDGSPPSEFSAIPLCRVAPRSVTLKPGEAQTIRVLVRRPEGLAAGEYRSHLRVKIVNNDVEEKQVDNNNLNMVVRPNLVMIIPLIIRQGETSFTASLSEAKISNDSKGSMLQVYIGREGNRSAEGNLKAYQGHEGSLTEIGAINGVPVYRPTARRLVKVPLEKYTPGAPVIVRYERPDKDGGGVLAETKVGP